VSCLQFRKKSLLRGRLTRNSYRAIPSDQGIQAFVELWKQILTGSDCHGGCPVLAVATEEPSDDTTGTTTTAGDVLTEWQRILTRSLTDAGTDPAPAEDFATTIVAAIEGRSRQPLMPNHARHLFRAHVKAPGQGI
jgi:hypothetical protein